MSTAITQSNNRLKVQELMDKVSDKRLSQEDRMTTVGQVLALCAPKMMAVLPKHVTPDRMIRVAMNCIRKTPRLLECDPASLFSAITEAAQYGWELGGILGHAYLVPYGKECTLVPGYKGLLDLGRRSGQISTYAMEVVRDGDQFSYGLGDDPFINHTPNDKDKDRHNKEVTHVYAVVRLRDGGVQRSVWTTAQIDGHKERYSQAWRWAENGDPKRGGGKKDSAWHTDWVPMAKKTVVKEMFGRGLIPVSAEYRELVDRAVKHEDQPTIDFAELMAIDSVSQPRIEESKSELQPTTDNEIPATESDSGPLSDLDPWEKFCIEFNEAPDGVLPHRNVHKKWFGPNTEVQWTAEQIVKADKMLADYDIGAHANRGSKSNTAKGASQKNLTGVQ